ncbi:hypothetical protein CR513_40447, partial [Mucuna pruriens]
MNPTQLNYTTTEKELLEIVFALDKFRSYLLGSRIIVFSDYAALKLLLKKSDANFHQRRPDCTKRDSKVMPNTTYGMILTFVDSTMIKSYTGASRMSRSIRFSNFVLQHLEATIMDQLRQPKKCLIVGSIGLPFSEMLINSSPPTKRPKSRNGHK